MATFSIESGSIEKLEDLVLSEGESKLLEDLVLSEGESKLSVFMITGKEGIGKTTLARSIFKHASKSGCFYIRAWVGVCQEFHARNIVESILFSLGTSRSKEEIARTETMELMEQLYKVLRRRKYLVVLDGVRSREAWNTLRSAFPDDRKGSRIVITTRTVEVEEYAAPTGKIHRMKPLSLDGSWELFKIKSGLQDQDTPEIKNIKELIMKYCGGLPLAVTVMGSNMRGKDSKYVQLKLKKHQNSESTTHKFLALSYNELPSHLKPCFLYLGHFPPDQAIHVESLCLLWIAEEFISTRGENNKTRMEVAECYFNELVDRSLVTLVENEGVSPPRRSKSCQINDLVHEFCISQGKREESFEVIDFRHGKKISTLARKIFVYLNKFEDANDAESMTSEAKKTTKSMVFVDPTHKSGPKTTWPREFSDLKDFHETKVLEFNGVDFGVKKLPVEKLIYLSFQECYLQELPSYVSNFSLLETLDLRVRISCVMTIPNDIFKKISSLRHLYFPHAFKTNKNDHKVKLDTLKTLEILENFHAGVCDSADLRQLKKLQVFTGIVSGNTADLKNTINCVDKNESLRQSSIMVRKFDSYSTERRSTVELLMQCKRVHALEIEGYLDKFPCPEAKLTDSNLTEMVFNGSEFSEDPVKILGKLPKLRSLVLCRDAYVGAELVCSDGEDFPELTSLKLATLQSLKKLEVQEGAMQKLTVLTIEHCKKLEIPPDGGLMKIPTLRKLMIGGMPEKFQNGVEKMVKETTDLRYEVTFYGC